MIADDWSDLTDDSLQHAIDKTESNGAPPATDTVCAPTDYLVWTNVSGAGGGVFMADYDCSDWTNGTSSNDSVLWGDSAHADNIWNRRPRRLGHRPVLQARLAVLLRAMKFMGLTALSRRLRDKEK